MIYRFATETILKKIKAIQNKALRICCSAFRTFPTAALQVEVGEAPLNLHRNKIRLNY